MPKLRFEVTHSYRFPRSPARFTPPWSPTAMTVARVGSDPVLVFLVQTSYADEFVLLNLRFDAELGAFPTPPGRETTSGIAYDAGRQKIFCGSATNDREHVYVVDADTFAEVDDHDLSLDTVWPLGGMFEPQSLATDGKVYAQAGRSNIVGTGYGGTVNETTIQLRDLNGTLKAEKTFSDRWVRGMTRFGPGWALVDAARHEIVVIDEHAKMVATVPGFGPADGMHAIAADTVSDFATEPQLSVPPGALGAIGTLYHPDTPWSPKPWHGRHRLYVANAADQTITAGYLTEA